MYRNKQYIAELVLFSDFFWGEKHLKIFGGHLNSEKQKQKKHFEVKINPGVISFEGDISQIRGNPHPSPLLVLTLTLYIHLYKFFLKETTEETTWFHLTLPEAF